MKYNAWNNFNEGSWTEEINVEEFIQLNYKQYLDNSSFLTKPTAKTLELMSIVNNLFKKERENNGVIGMDKRISGITAFGPGYVNKDLELIVGLQTEKPLERAYMPMGGIRTAIAAAQSYGIETDKNNDEIFLKYRKTHNQGVFDAYTDDMRKARHTHIITGLPDAYARGRIIGDYRRIALYGIDFLIQQKKNDLKKMIGAMSNSLIQLREEVSEQIRALISIKEMAASYGYDISSPAINAHEAIQWTYFGYLAAIKEQNGAAMSVGRVSTFFDIYIERDLQSNLITEEQAQELIDQFVIKLRMVRFMRAPAYNDLFSGDPVWATESIGGMSNDGKTLVTKSSYRIIHTLSNLGPSPEPNLTVLWSEHLPENFKKFTCDYSIKYSSLQYENDEVMRPLRGDDYGIACCVSPMKLGKEMQFFGARANLAKTLLYAINGGYDELHPDYQLGPKLEQLPINTPLSFDVIMNRFSTYIDWLCNLYVNTLNVIHYMHDKYYYESAEMSLCDTNIHRFFATGIAGLSVVIDSLSAIKNACVTPVWKQIENTDRYIAVDFKIDGEFPKFGNDNDEVDQLGIEVLKIFKESLLKNKPYRDSEITTSILTITSNVVYGKTTGATPDGRASGQAFAPGANPMHNRDCCGAICSLNSVAKLPFSLASDGISNTFTIIPQNLGSNENERINNLVNLLDGYFSKGAQHINVNVLDRELLKDAQLHPENYPQLTIRVSGYAVNFIKLSKEQQDEVISRTFHSKL